MSVAWFSTRDAKFACGSLRKATRTCSLDARIVSTKSVWRCSLCNQADALSAVSKPARVTCSRTRMKIETHNFWYRKMTVRLSSQGKNTILFARERALPDSCGLLTALSWVARWNKLQRNPLPLCSLWVRKSDSRLRGKVYRFF